MVVTKHRKALSSHPKAAQWPAASVAAMRRSLTENGEYTLYNASLAKLDSRISGLEKEGVDVKGEVRLLGLLQKRVTAVSFTSHTLLFNQV